MELKEKIDLALKTLILLVLGYGVFMLSCYADSDHEKSCKTKGVKNHHEMANHHMGPDKGKLDRKCGSSCCASKEKCDKNSKKSCCASKHKHVHSDSDKKMKDCCGTTPGKCCNK